MNKVSEGLKIQKTLIRIEGAVHADSNFVRLISLTVRVT